MSLFVSAKIFSQLGRRNNATTAADDAQYGYVPQQAVAILFLALYGLSTTFHVGQAMHFRTWWLLPTAALCGLGEMAGWTGRLWSSMSPTDSTPFMIQITATILAPTPLLAATFMIMSRIVQQLGTQYSYLTPRWYTYLFLPCDVTALVVQAIGGAQASAADDLAAANAGSRVMLGGIGFQFAVIIIFSVIALDFTWRYIRDKPLRASSSARGVFTRRLRIMLGALAFSTIVLVIRRVQHLSIYRVIELTGGWDGPVIRTEVYFNIFDGGMVVLAMLTLNLAHPGLMLRSPAKEQAMKLQSMESLLDGRSI
ncbi:RTA1-domain-containing protein [Mycena vitilis]|nr:RTA1-domain-containing protein [Mycena vitilis]